MITMKELQAKVRKLNSATPVKGFYLEVSATSTQVMNNDIPVGEPSIKSIELILKQEHRSHAIILANTWHGVNDQLNYMLAQHEANELYMARYKQTNNKLLVLKRENSDAVAEIAKLKQQINNDSTDLFKHDPSEVAALYSNVCTELDSERSKREYLQVQLNELLSVENAKAVICETPDNHDMVSRQDFEDVQTERNNAVSSVGQLRDIIKKKGDKNKELFKKLVSTESELARVTKNYDDYVKQIQDEYAPMIVDYEKRVIKWELNDKTSLHVQALKNEIEVLHATNAKQGKVINDLRVELAGEGEPESIVKPRKGTFKHKIDIGTKIKLTSKDSGNVYTGVVAQSDLLGLYFKCTDKDGIDCHYHIHTLAQGNMKLESIVEQRKSIFTGQDVTMSIKIPGTDEFQEIGCGKVAELKARQVGKTNQLMAMHEWQRQVIADSVGIASAKLWSAAEWANSVKSIDTQVDMKPWRSSIKEALADASNENKLRVIVIA